MRTPSEIGKEASELKENVDRLYAHFQRVQTWPNDLKKAKELGEILKHISAAHTRIQELAMEMIASRLFHNED